MQSVIKSRRVSLRIALSRISSIVFGRRVPPDSFSNAELGGATAIGEPNLKSRPSRVRTGQFFAQGLFDHYAETIREIRKTGYTEYFAREFRPYLRGAAAQFSMSHRSLTEELLERGSKVRK